MLIRYKLYVGSNRYKLKNPSFNGKGSFVKEVVYENLNFTMPNGGTITLTRNGTPTTVVLEYSLDGIVWSEWTESSNVRTITLQAGDKVYIRNQSNTSTRFSTSKNNYYQFAFSDSVNAYGDVRSLLCANPASGNLSNYCFNRLFFHCSTMLIAPLLEAKVLSTGCYRQMFGQCSSLTAIPDLPANTLKSECYYSIFGDCTSITSAVIKATTYDVLACSYMFYNCSSLNELTILTTDISSSNCTFNWLLNVASSGVFNCYSDLAISENSSSGIPSGWTRHNIDLN